MYNCPQVIKDLYLKDSINKNIRIAFPNGEHPDITNCSIVANSFNLTETLCAEQTFKFGLGGRSVFSISLLGITQDLTEYEIDVYSEISLKNVDTSSIPAEDIKSSSDVPFPYYRLFLGRFTISEFVVDVNGKMSKVTAYSKGSIKGVTKLNFLEYFKLTKVQKTFQDDEVKKGLNKYSIDYDKFLHLHLNLKEDEYNWVELKDVKGNKDGTAHYVTLTKYDIDPNNSRNYKELRLLLKCWGDSNETGNPTYTEYKNMAYGNLTFNKSDRMYKAKCERVSTYNEGIAKINEIFNRPDAVIKEWQLQSMYGDLDSLQGCIMTQLYNDRFTKRQRYKYTKYLPLDQYLYFYIPGAYVKNTDYRHYEGGGVWKQITDKDDPIIKNLRTVYSYCVLYPYAVETVQVQNKTVTATLSHSDLYNPKLIYTTDISGGGKITLDINTTWDRWSGSVPDKYLLYSPSDSDVSNLVDNATSYISDHLEARALFGRISRNNFVELIDINLGLPFIIGKKAIIGKRAIIGKGKNFIKLTPDMIRLNSEYNTLNAAKIRYCYVEWLNEKNKLIPLLLDLETDGNQVYDFSNNTEFTDTVWEDEDAVITFIEENFKPKVTNISYAPHITRLNGMPFLETGDRLRIMLNNGEYKDTIILKRSLNGEQYQTDTLEASKELEKDVSIYQIAMTESLENVAD